MKCLKQCRLCCLRKINIKFYANEVSYCALQYLNFFQERTYCIVCVVICILLVFFMLVCMYVISAYQSQCSH